MPTLAGSDQKATGGFNPSSMTNFGSRHVLLFAIPFELYASRYFVDGLAMGIGSQHRSCIVPWGTN